MALVLGTNCGFVTVAPTADPSGSDLQIDERARAMKVIPEKNCSVSEIGWYCDNATEAANFEVAIYSHNSTNDEPQNLIASSIVNAKGTDAGWKTASIEADLNAGETYWIAVQLDNTATTTNINRTSDAGERYSYYLSATELTDPWSSSTEIDDYVLAIYALYTENTNNDYVEVGTGTAGEKELMTRWPVEEGLTAGTQKQTGRVSNLVADAMKMDGTFLGWGSI